MKTRSLLSAVLAAALIVPAVAPAQQKYPAKSVRIVLPFTAGSAVDTLARLYAQQMTESWGQQVLVDNRPGANGIIGMEAIAKSPPDGYTIGMGNIATLAINSSLYPKLLTIRCAITRRFPIPLRSPTVSSSIRRFRCGR